MHTIMHAFGDVDVLRSRVEGEPFVPGVAEGEDVDEGADDGQIGTHGVGRLAPMGGEFEGGGSLTGLMHRMERHELCASPCSTQLAF
eukprot:SAG31_NODE_12288_length_952_cov_1.249707_2_plen_87_part_00